MHAAELAAAFDAVVRYAAAPESPRVAFRHVHKDGTGLMNNAGLNYDKLDDDEAADVEDEYLGLQQPPRELHGQKVLFAFTPEGEKRHRRLIELLTKASKRGTRREEIELSKHDVVWESRDGQLALKPRVEQYAAAVEFAVRVRYAREHEDVNRLAAVLPFAATRATSDGSLPPHRAALADALLEAGRDDEHQIAADPSKNLRLHHEGEDGWRVDESPQRSSTQWYQGTVPREMRQYSPAVRQYLETALWSSTHHLSDDHGDEEEYSLNERHDVNDFHHESVARAHHDIEKFKSRLSPDARQAVEDDEGQAGHDLWLTRNGHGAGFWDGDWEHGDELTAAAESLGEQHVDVEPIDEDTTHLHLSGGRE